MTARVWGLLRWSALSGALLGLASPAPASLFWSKPSLGGAPAAGGEVGITQPLPDATPAEQRANLIWTLRAGLNVAALQCQFAPALHTVDSYNNMLRQHAAELQSSYAALGAYFKRTTGKTWQTALDSYTTKTYNSFSTLQAQLIFCETAASIGRQTEEEGRGHLGEIATARMRELRNSLVPVGDRAFAVQGTGMAVEPIDTTPHCYDKKGREKPCKIKK